MVNSVEGVVSTQDLSAFLRSMPPSYERLFDRAEAQEHLKILAARGTRPAHSEVWSSRQKEGLPVCIVTDCRVGLLSLVSDAFSQQDLEVLTAHVFQRRSATERRESLILVWVQRGSNSSLPQNVETDDVRDMTYALGQLVQEQERADELLRVANQKVGARVEQPRVYYDTHALRAGEFVLVVEAPDCPGLLLAVTRALFRQRAEIVASEVRTEEGLARDRFAICGASGTHLTPNRLADVQQGVLSAVRRLVARQFAT